MMKLDWSRGALAEGLACYRSEEFFLAHEHWEGVWLEAQEPEKTFLQALIQIAAAFHHLQRGNRQGAASLLRRASGRIDPFAVTFAGVMLEPLREDLGAWLQTLAERDAPLRLPLPRIPQICTDASPEECV